MKVSFIRFNRATQVNSVRPGKISSVWTSDKENFSFFTVFTVGWEAGARCRIRNLQSLRSVEAYLRKLNEGGWLSSTDYRLATEMVAKLGLIE